MAASNAGHRLKFSPSTTYIQQLQEMKKHVKFVELSKWIIFVKNAGQLTLFTGVVNKIILLFTTLRLNLVFSNLV